MGAPQWRPLMWPGCQVKMLIFVLRRSLLLNALFIRCGKLPTSKTVVVYAIASLLPWHLSPPLPGKSFLYVCGKKAIDFSVSVIHCVTFKFVLNTFYTYLFYKKLKYTYVYIIKLTCVYINTSKHIYLYVYYLHYYAIYGWHDCSACFIKASKYTKLWLGRRTTQILCMRWIKDREEKTWAGLERAGWHERYTHEKATPLSKEK